MNFQKTKKKICSTNANSATKIWKKNYLASSANAIDLSKLAISKIETIFYKSESNSGGVWSGPLRDGVLAGFAFFYNDGNRIF